VFSSLEGAGAVDVLAFLFLLPGISVTIVAGGCGCDAARTEGRRTSGTTCVDSLAAGSTWSANSFTLPFRTTLYRRSGKRPLSSRTGRAATGIGT
jgi:hypothetical protein